MRNHLIVVSTAIAFVSGPAAHAGTIDFIATGAVVDYTIPVTADYAIVAFGAQGERAASSHPRPAVWGRKSAAIFC
jgi:hypothetical protein